MRRYLAFLFVILGWSLSASAQVAPQFQTLIPGQSVERAIAGGESHTYQINLAAGQFVRFRLEQRAIDCVMTLTAPDGKQLREMNLTPAGDEESVSFAVETAGSYHLIVKGRGEAVLRGSYRLEGTVHASVTAEDRKRLAAEALLVEANDLLKQGDKAAQQAIGRLDQALLLWRGLGDTYWAPMTIKLIGNANQALGNNEKALDYYRQALAIFREFKYRNREGLTLLNIGVSYQTLRQYQKAIDHYEQALPIIREERNRAYEAVVLYSLSVAYYYLARYEKAVEYAEQALPIYRELKNRMGELNALTTLGDSYNLVSRNEKAIEYLEPALVISRELKNRAGELNALTTLGESYNWVGRSEKAIEYLEPALAISRELKNRAGEASALYWLGVAYRRLSRYQKAIECLEPALAMSREMKDRGLEGNALGELGVVYGNLSDNERSIEYLEPALVIARELKHLGVEANVLTNLGVAYRRLGHYEKGIEYLEQALASSRERKDRGAEAYALKQLGESYSGLGRNEKAIEYYEPALAISREVKNRELEAFSFGALGRAYIGLSQSEKAIPYFEQALAIYRETKDRSNEAGRLDDLGFAYINLKRPEKAIEYLEQALAISREVKFAGNEMAALEHLGLAYNRLSRPGKAIECYEQALVISHGVHARDHEATITYGLASAERSQGNLSAARTHLEESLTIAESLRSDEISSPELRASFLTTVQDIYHLYTEVLMRQHHAQPTKGFDALAVETSERQRARSLLDLLTERRADLEQGVDVALLERERSLHKQLNEKAQLLTQAKPEQVDALKNEISQLETDYERAQAAIRKASPHYAALVQPQPLKVTEIQAQLDADTLLLEYSLSEDHSYLWAISRESLSSYELPKGELIEKSAREVYGLLTARSTSKRDETPAQRQTRIIEAEAKLRAAAEELSRMILAPVAAQLGNKRVVVVADGALQYIPFAMLPEPSVVHGQSSLAKKNAPRTTDNGQPLIVKHEVVSVPSASALAIQRRELAGRLPAPRMLAVIADPVFDRSDERFKTVATDAGSDKTPATNADDARSIEHLAGTSGDKSDVKTVRMVIPRLPYTRQEANKLMALTPEGSSFEAIDFQASRETALDPALSQYRYVHIATHGLLDTERPGLSALVFSMLDAEGRPQNAFLRANDIYNLKLPAELVVLSACQTGLGKEIKGEGLVGLTRGFMYAGAARVVVSLWNVNDKATADLMTKFYEKMLKQGQAPAAALRAAQVEMWKQQQWQSPYYWAAFTMQGEWR